MDKRDMETLPETEPDINNPEVARRWHAEVSANGSKWHTWFAWAIIVIYPSWTLFDYLLVYDHWQLFGLIRLLGAAVIGAYLTAGKLFKFDKPVILGYLNVLTMYISIAYMMPFTGEAMWFYSLGYCTAFIVAGLLLYWEWIHSLATTVIASAFYAGFFIVLGEQSATEIIGGGAFLTLTLAIISVVLLAMRMNLNKKEFLLRMQLVMTQDQLKERLDEISALKFQQDGDYYLTSQLIKPLASSDVFSESVKVQTRIQQKKTFKFRKWDEQLGGDINIAHRIELDGKSYVVFLNADAMGKSMQGAGGILVLGALFKAIIDRTNLIAGIKSQYPERWLKNTFIELHRVFESFDGSMLVSLVLGLVQEDTGLTYYINAEHPLPVLLREGEAEFLQAERRIFYKLGTMGLKGPLSISLFHLKPGDSIILGSDGRDDLKIERDGGIEINSNERLFLGHVARNHGDLDKIFNAIQDTGVPIDDISLMKITYSPKTAPKGSENGNVLPSVRELKTQVKAMIENKEYSDALELTETMLSNHPGQSEILFAASYLYKRVGLLEKAANVGERLKLRSPDLAKNLLNLAEVHWRLGNHDRSEFILEKLDKQRDELKDKNIIARLEQMERMAGARRANMN